MKTAILILNDPKNGDEALGRTFNALGLASEAIKANDEVEIVFAGAGTRWPAELTKLGHPLHALYQEVRPAVAGASCGCGKVFGTSESVAASGLNELKQNAVTGAPSEIASLRRYVTEGWSTQIF